MGSNGPGRPLFHLLLLCVLLLAGPLAAEEPSGAHNATRGGLQGAGGSGSPSNATAGGLHGSGGSGTPANASSGSPPHGHGAGAPPGKPANASSGPGLHGTGGKPAHGNSSHPPQSSKAHNASAGSVHGPPQVSNLTDVPRNVSDGTVRVDPLDSFKKYRGGYDITNKHYWSSVIFTGIPGYAIAVVWLLAGAGYGAYGILASRHTTNGAGRYAKKAPLHTRKPRHWPVAVAIILTVSVIVTSSVALAGSFRFHSSAFSIRRVLGRVGDDASATIANITAAVTAMQVNPVAFKEIEKITHLNATSLTLTGVGFKIQDKAEKSVNLIGNGLNILRTTTTVIVSLNLAIILALLGSRFLRFNRTLQMLLILCWLMTALFWMIFGLFFFLGGFAGDTCTALADYRQDPRNSSLGAILPCSSQASGNSALRRTRAGIHNLIDTVNKNISAIQTDLRQHPLGTICNPFTGWPEYRYVPDRCTPANTTKIGDIPQVLKRFTCSWSEEGSGCGSGRFIPVEDLRTLTVYTTSVQTLLDSFPGIERLVDCQLVEDAFSQVLFNDCRPLKKYARMSWACMAAGSTVMVLLSLTWLAMERRRGDKSHAADGSVIPQDHSQASTPDRGEVAEKGDLPLVEP